MPTDTIAAIERQLDFHAAPDRLWRAITDETELSAWFGHRTRLDLRPGGEGWFEWEGHGRIPVRVEAVEPPRLFARRWGDMGEPISEERSTLVEWRLEPQPGGGTRLHLRESGFRTDDSRWDNTEGWLTELAALAGHVAEEPWRAGIHKTYRLRSPIDRVWRTFAEPGELAAWWSGSEDLEIRPGFEGWWDWPKEGGRYAMRIEAVEPPRYLSWSWATTPGQPLATASQVLRTEWVLVPRADGGTDVHLLETGFTGPKDFGINDAGWDGDVLPKLRERLGEA